MQIYIQAFSTNMPNQPTNGMETYFSGTEMHYTIYLQAKLILC